MQLLQAYSDISHWCSWREGSYKKIKIKQALWEEYRNYIALRSARSQRLSKPLPLLFSFAILIFYLPPYRCLSLQVSEVFGFCHIPVSFTADLPTLMVILQLRLSSSQTVIPILPTFCSRPQVLLSRDSESAPPHPCLTGSVITEPQNEFPNYTIFVCPFMGDQNSPKGFPPTQEF